MNGRKKSNEGKRVDHYLAELDGVFAEDVGAKETLHFQVLDDVEIHEGDDFDSGFVAMMNEQKERYMCFFSTSVMISRIIRFRNRVM